MSDPWLIDTWHFCWPHPTIWTPPSPFTYLGLWRVWFSKSGCSLELPGAERTNETSDFLVWCAEVAICVCSSLLVVCVGLWLFAGGLWLFVLLPVLVTTLAPYTGCLPNQRSHFPWYFPIFNWFLPCFPWLNIGPEEIPHTALTSENLNTYHYANLFKQTLAYLSKKVCFNFIMKKENQHLIILQNKTTQLWKGLMMWKHSNFN